ncbi:MAG: DNA-protecting protein DprA [Rhodospirillaceae bacterium]|jgi:DNA processing protein|nr:DNA-protecting protein DprA [Rhodospirillaceae bacterium]|tara:strand:- start:3407 stop:4546 length:1140 start_codon:yes stop_codon:yes gene_type:complete
MSDENKSRPQALSEAEKLDWLRLIRSDNVGPITFYKLLERFATARAALEALPDLARHGGGKRLKVFSKAQAEAEVEALERIGARLVSRGGPDYPPLLAHIEDAPPLIGVLGHAHLLAKKAIAVVGARNASVNGCRFARKIAANLGQGGLLVVSGMARGIDAAAHEGTIATGTLAVLGGGLDVVYPKENSTLYEKIVAEGALISEVPPGARPLARHFPRRNRLISGIARGVVIVEASPRSGSLITARMALEQGREVFAVPGSAVDPRARGTNHLIRQGAILTESAEDVFQALNEAERTPLKEREPFDFKEVSLGAPAPDEVEETRGAIEKSLSPTPSLVDEIIRNCQFSPPVVSWVLLELELAGRLERHPGNQVSLIQGP